MSKRKKSQSNQRYVGKPLLGIRDSAVSPQLSLNFSKPSLAWLLRFPGEQSRLNRAVNPLPTRGGGLQGKLEHQEGSAGGSLQGKLEHQEGSAGGSLQGKLEH